MNKKIILLAKYLNYNTWIGLMILRQNGVWKWITDDIFYIVIGLMVNLIIVAMKDYSDVHTNFRRSMVIGMMIMVMNYQVVIELESGCIDESACNYESIRLSR